ncbi:MAG TPA: lipid-binding SYLF domain-containing protein [Pyrinomonadaceae bacterium]|nr:lipid-binding SYLF domain-containing protein [Pyrinomonadaceae bacterium]
MKSSIYGKATQLFLILIAVFVTAAIIPAQKTTKQNSRDLNEAKKTSAEAAKVFNEVMRISDRAIPKDLLDRAEAVAIFPGVINAAFIIGGRGGVGVISRRTLTGWSAPAFFKLGGGSFGAQIGGQKIDLIMLVMNQDGLKGLLEDKFEIGGEATVAAGPVGRSSSATTNATLDAEILSYSRAKGLFAGVSIKGAVISPDNDRNQAVYGLVANQILAKNSNEVKIPADVNIVPRTLNGYSSRRGRNQ